MAISKLPPGARYRQRPKGPPRDPPHRPTYIKPAALRTAHRRIPRIESIADVDQVAVENSSDAVFTCDAQGQAWIRKREANTGCEPLLAEAIGWLLGRELDVPIPDASVCLVAAERSWLSRRVPDVVHWDPESYLFIKNSDGLGFMLTLDLILLNEDRHAGNILLQPDPDMFQLRVWAIDMGNALVGYPDEYAARGDDLPDTRNLARGFPFDLVAASAKEAAARAARIPPVVLRSFIDDSCDIARESKADLLWQALQARCNKAPTLIDRYLALRLGEPS